LTVFTGRFFVSNPTSFVKFTKGNPNIPGEFTFTSLLDCSLRYWYFPDFITFFCHQVAQCDYQHVSVNNWVAQGGASQK
jgi:lipid-A-disaccharide synthase-like uncharacterized protein